MLHSLYMELNEVRKRYLDYMRDRGHSVLASAPLVPREDSTTLFTGSGMQPLVPYLLGKEHPKGTRLANAQKCFRANDIDEVGDNRHTTFFEMLGNWSLGSYFKKEQIEQCFLFLTDPNSGLGLNPERLYVSVFAGDKLLNIPRDEESAEVWRQLFTSAGVTAETAHIGSKENGDRRGIKNGERIFFYDADENWWSRSGSPDTMPVGEPGGPDTEVFYDFGDSAADPAYADMKPHPASDSGRFVEIGNSVFMQHIRTKNGFTQLPKKNVDFGGGLERLVAATEDTADIFRIDAFASCISALAERSGIAYDTRPRPFRIVADHLRAAMFIAADGVSPSNTDQGYVLRRLVRSAVYNVQYGLGIADLPLTVLVPSMVSMYADRYPEIAEERVVQTIGDEEERFITTLQKGTKVFDAIAKKGAITGEEMFTLQSTYGFPKELTISLAREKHVSVSSDGYVSAMHRHRESSRQASERKFKGGLADASDMSVKYHTATHLLHQALRDVLGNTVEQRGSNITPERLRFDFSYDRKLTDEEKKQVETVVNDKIQEGLEVRCMDMPLEEARRLGAIGTFEYGDTVRVYCIGEYSKEFCGGPHVGNTADLGSFRITKEESVAAGIRRIKAVLE